MARLTSEIMSTTGSPDTALKASMQKCPAIEVTTTHSAPAGNKAVREPGIDEYLRCCVIACEIAEKSWRVGMHNRQLERRLLASER